MKKIEIFDPAMCCPTGLCGTNIDPELMRIEKSLFHKPILPPNK